MIWNGWIKSEYHNAQSAHRLIVWKGRATNGKELGPGRKPEWVGVHALWKGAAIARLQLIVYVQDYWPVISRSDFSSGEARNLDCLKCEI